MRALCLALVLLSCSAVDREEPRDLGLDEEWPADFAISATEPIVVVAGSEGTLLALSAYDGSELVRWSPGPGSELQPWSVAVSPTGRTVALLSHDQRVYLWSPSSAAAPRHVATLPDGPGREVEGWTFGSFLEFSSTGEHILVGIGEVGALLLDAEGRTLLTLAKLGGTMFQAPLAWSRDGRRFAAAVGTNVQVYDAATTAPLDVTLPQTRETVQSLALDATGSRLAVGTLGATVLELDLATGALRWQASYSDELARRGSLYTHMGIQMLAYSPDGDWLAATTGSEVRGLVIEADSGRLHWLSEFHGARIGGEPAAIDWDLYSRDWTFGHVSGVMPLHRVQIRGGRAGSVEEHELPCGSVPKRGHGGMAFSILHPEDDEQPSELIAFRSSVQRPSWRVRI